ncbi:hypothetical protein [Vulgatibacter sp.]|uniref:hypothetical protein n=1 Tax=Vulgatibacter sp. TaxID=1971226 RepID=UPI003564DFF9
MAGLLPVAVAAAVPEAELSEAELQLLKDVRNGADVWGRPDARLCRQLEQRGLVKIVDAMEKPPGHMRQPYFGCIATELGKQALRIGRKARGAA